MDSGAGDGGLLAGVAGRNVGAFRVLYEPHAGWLAVRLARLRQEVSWRTGTGRYRNVGTHVRDGVEHAEPSLEDAYLLLLLRSASPQPETTQEAAS